MKNFFENDHQRQNDPTLNQRRWQADRQIKRWRAAADAMLRPAGPIPIGAVVHDPNHYRGIKKGEVIDLSKWDPAATYAPGPCPAKYFRR